MELYECPVRIAVDVIGGKWKPVILYYLGDGPKRFSELRRLIPAATQKMLTQQLRELEKDGIIDRKVFPVVPPKVEYALSTYGRTLEPLLEAMCAWGRKHRERLASVSNGQSAPKSEKAA
jgi:DNA-binding HxlR family transcriptional regulator